MIWAANQSLRIERDIMLRYPGEKDVFYILFERMIILTGIVTQSGQKVSDRIRGELAKQPRTENPFCIIFILATTNIELQLEVIVEMSLGSYIAVGTTQHIYTQWTRKLSPPLLDAVKVKAFLCWSNSDIMANTNANIL